VFIHLKAYTDEEAACVVQFHASENIALFLGELECGRF
jgi:hypothetical protein